MTDYMSTDYSYRNRNVCSCNSQWNTSDTLLIKMAFMLLQQRLKPLQRLDPEPRNVHELRSFLGLVNYYGKSIRHLSTLIQPLNHLLCRNVPWKWSKDCQKAFDALKKQLASSEVLVHYDPDFPLKLDAMLKA